MFSSRAMRNRLRIEKLSQAVAEEVESQHCEHDHEPGENREVRCVLNIADTVAEHDAPARRGRRVSHEREDEPEGHSDHPNNAHRLQHEAGYLFRLSPMNWWIRRSSKLSRVSSLPGAARAIIASISG